MPELAQPYEIYEWTDGETQDWTIQRYEEGDLEIHPRDGRAPKMIQVVRIHLDPEEKPSFPHYWDLTSSRLYVQLTRLLSELAILPVRVKITAIGRAPRTHYSVTYVPPELA